MQKRLTTLMVAVLMAPLPTLADVWVFEPSAALDLRIDDNYTIDTRFSDPINATRLVGSLGLSRESQNTAIKGLVRVDGLLQQSDSESSELSSNQIVFFDTKYNSARSVLGLSLNYKQDTPSRDISADITDISATAADTGASVTQDQNVGRERFVLSPSYEFKLSRRTTFNTALTYTDVQHELPTVEDAILARWNAINAANPIPPPSDLSFDTPGIGVFQVIDELDDFTETEFKVGLKHSWSPLVTLSASVSLKQYEALAEVDSRIRISRDQEILDPRTQSIGRRPRRSTKSETFTVSLGFERLLSPTLTIGFNIGAYNLENDDRAMFRPDDDYDTGNTGNTFESLLAEAESSETGWLGGITISKQTGLTRYSGRFGVDIFPSDIGSQVESLDLIGDLVRELSPRMDFAFRARAYEPDTINAVGADEFARRFISFEPKIIYQYSRAWTVAGSYRYRRQKSRADVNSGESNAFLVSLKYTPPSAIRDAARGGQ